MTDSVEPLVRQWLEWDEDPGTRDAIAAMWERREEDALRRVLVGRLAFGTAGLRAVMGPGNTQMNRLTIIQTSQGLATYLQSQFTEADLRTRGVAIGFDGRHHSDVFARLAATAMRARGVKTYVFQQVVPTPMVAFAVREHRCVAGVMVTASHNPKEYNGYKVFWENGAQIKGPHDKGIAEAILTQLEPWPGAWKDAWGDEDPFEQLTDRYFHELAERYVPRGRGGTVRFAYSAMHGVGSPFTQRSLALCGVPWSHVFPVTEQDRPDPDFPTVVFPNPEEGKGALALAIATADANGANVILANDPDADRLAVAERQDDAANPWRVFTGNELGALLGWWAVDCARQDGRDLAKCHLLSSTVSSPILASIAAKEGMHYTDTLTGFKWMGSEAERIERTGEGKVLFAFEEAIGFMFDTIVYDKDGVSAAGVVADLACYLQQHEGGKTLAGKLEDVFNLYGHHFALTSYVICRDPAKMREVFVDIATMEEGTYPSRVAGVPITGVRDLFTGLDTRMPDRVARLPVCNTSPMITFFFENGIKMTVRGSGTEPKLKWYGSFVTDRADGDAFLREFVAKAVEELIQPDRRGFERRAAE